MSPNHPDTERLTAAIETRKRLREETLEILKQVRQSVRSGRSVYETIRDVPDWRHVRPEDDELA